MSFLLQFNSLRIRKYKPAMTKKNIAKWKLGMVVKNKQLKKLGQSKMNFEQYVDYAHGIAPKRDLKRDRSVYQPPQETHRTTIDYPSVPMSTKGNTTKKDSLYYTGERKLLGIATMHKSNAVPIFEDDKQHAIDIARMRR